MPGTASKLGKALYLHKSKAVVQRMYTRHVVWLVRAKKRGMHNALLSDFGPQVIKSVGQFEPVAKRIRGHAKSANGRQNCVGLANILQVNGYELRIDTLNCGLFFGRINFRVERRQ